MLRSKTGACAAALGVLSVCLLSATAVSADDVREFYITTVHVDGRANLHGDANHKPEPFPTAKLPAGRGLVLTPPNEKGAWKMRAFTFEPSQITVHEGDHVRLHFVGAQGMRHHIRVDGQGVNSDIDLKRGYVQTVDIPSAKAGIIKIICDDHQPSMNAQLFILPRAN